MNSSTRCRCAITCIEAGGWRERLVGLDEEGRLAFGLGAAHETAIAAPGEPDDILEVGVAA